MTTSEHIDPSIAPANLADMEDSDQGDIPEGVVRFDITAEEIADAIAAESLEVCTHTCKPFFARGTSNMGETSIH